MCPTSLLTKGMQIKTIISYHYMIALKIWFQSLTIPMSERMQSNWESQKSLFISWRMNENWVYFLGALAAELWVGNACTPPPKEKAVDGWLQVWWWLFTLTSNPLLLTLGNHHFWICDLFPARPLTDTDLYLLSQNFHYPLKSHCPTVFNSGGLRNKVKKTRRKPCRNSRLREKSRPYLLHRSSDFIQALRPS